jgi:hypothetical protein
LEDRGGYSGILLGINVGRYVMRWKAEGVGFGTCPVADFVIYNVELTV